MPKHGGHGLQPGLQCSSAAAHGVARAASPGLQQHGALGPARHAGLASGAAAWGAAGTGGAAAGMGGPAARLAAAFAVGVTALPPRLPPAQTFIKVVNYQHMMPTRYTLEVRPPAGAPRRSGRRRAQRQRRGGGAAQLPALCLVGARPAVASAAAGRAAADCSTAPLSSPPSGGPQGRGDARVRRQQHQEGGGQQGGQGAAGGEVQERQEPVRGGVESGGRGAPAGAAGGIGAGQGRAVLSGPAVLQRGPRQAGRQAGRRPQAAALPCWRWAAPSVMHRANPTHLRPPPCRWFFTKLRF